MKTNIKILCGAVLALIAVAPVTVYGQSICEDLSAILVADREELEFVTVPGARCNSKRDGIECIWQKPPPPPCPPDDDYYCPVFIEWWATTISPDMKKLGAEIQKCIKQKAIPFEWGGFRKGDSFLGVVKKYYAQTELSKKNCEDPLLSFHCNRSIPRAKTIQICFEYDNEEVGAGIVLEIDLRKISGVRGEGIYCGW